MLSLDVTAGDMVGENQAEFDSNSTEAKGILH